MTTLDVGESRLWPFQLSALLQSSFRKKSRTPRGRDAVDQDARSDVQQFRQRRTSQLAAIDDQINGALVEQELGPLKTLGQFSRTVCSITRGPTKPPARPARRSPRHPQTQSSPTRHPSSVGQHAGCRAVASRQLSQAARNGLGSSASARPSLPACAHRPRLRIDTKPHLP